MKRKAYIFLFFISLSHVAFGQDSLVKAKDNVNLLFTSGSIYPQHNTSSLPPIYKNTYVLSQHQKDSLWSVVFAEDKTQDLFRLFQTSKDDQFYLIENQINLFAVLNSKSVNSKIKTALLFGKLKYDQEHANVNNQTQIFGTCGLGRPEIIEISSKEKAISSYFNNYDGGPDYNSKINLFALEGIMLIGVDYEKQQPIQAVEILKKEQFKLKKLRNKIIAGAEVNIYQPISQKNLLMVYYEKKS